MMMRYCVMLIVAAVLVAANDPDEQRDATALIESRGFACESHYVTTQDDYILHLFRIPSTGPVAFLQHGILDSADTWLLNSRTESLAYILADAGFDVWLGNSRGNKYSRNHTSLNPDGLIDGPIFWDFTWDDMAQLDVTAAVEYALAVAGKSKAVYIGHSQGTTQIFANLARSDWSLTSRLSLVVALAPVSWLEHTTSLLVRALADFDVDKIVQFLGVHEFLGTSKLLRWLLPTVCTATPALCESMVYLFAGLDPPNLNITRLPVYVSHFPSGASVKDMVHYAQSVRYGKFDMYDYGLVGNELHYHQLSAPNYDPSVIDMPVALFYGGVDPLGDNADVQNLIQHLPATSLAFNGYLPGYDHLDFVWGQTAFSDLYPQVVQLARQYAAN